MDYKEIWYMFSTGAIPDGYWMHGLGEKRSSVSGRQQGSKKFRFVQIDSQEQIEVRGWSAVCVYRA